MQVPHPLALSMAEPPLWLHGNVSSSGCPWRYTNRSVAWYGGSLMAGSRENAISTEQPSSSWTSGVLRNDTILSAGTDG